MVILAAIASAQQPTSREAQPDRYAGMTDLEIGAAVKTTLDRGLPVDSINETGLLIQRRSSLVLAMLENKIEEVLRSTNPRDCFTDKSVNADRFISIAAGNIAGSGDVTGIRELSKLVTIDEKRFGPFVNSLLYAAINRDNGNPFVVAYGGLDIGNPLLTKRILEWVKSEAEPEGIGTSPARPRPRQFTEWWAKAMVLKYGRIPTEMDWYIDPIASQVGRAVADSLHDDVLRLATTVYNQNNRK